MKTLGWITFILVIIGGLNWGLVGFFKYDLISAIFGNMSAMSRLIYDLVGLSALYMLIFGSQMMAKKPM
ncbi:MAG: DUF378 domain-containing protein [Candidatus Pacebacteria bacterium]|nr:DUF378 domain-containing protein [Candidatus Paceibacterota bacterium]